MPELTAVASLNDIADGDLLSVTRGDEEILLARIGDDVYAIGNLCSHAFAWLDNGELLADTVEVECPLHGGRFDLRTGKPTALPCVEPVRKYPVTVQDGQIFIGDAE